MVWQLEDDDCTEVLHSADIIICKLFLNGPKSLYVVAVGHLGIDVYYVQM